MMLAGPNLRVVVATTHIALRDVPTALTPAGIASTITLTAEALARRFRIARPRVAVAGLNPHAGEAGRFGDEETRLVEPALALARSRLAAAGVDAVGHRPARPRRRLPPGRGRRLRRRRRALSRPGPHPREAAPLRRGRERHAGPARSRAPRPITAPPSTSPARASRAPTASWPRSISRRASWADARRATPTTSRRSAVETGRRRVGRLRLAREARGPPRNIRAQRPSRVLAARARTAVSRRSERQIVRLQAQGLLEVRRRASRGFPRATLDLCRGRRGRRPPRIDRGSACPSSEAACRRLVRLGLRPHRGGPARTRIIARGCR